MKNRIRTFFSQCFDTLRLCPSEALICLFFFVYGALTIQEAKIVESYETYMFIFPLFLTASILLNGWTARGGAVRWLYYASPLLAVPFLWVDVQDWVNSVAYGIAIAICPLMVLISRWRRDNVDFVGDGLNYVKNLFFAGVLTGAAMGLVAAIYFSLRYIFPGLPLGEPEKVMAYAAMVMFIVLLPLIFLTFVRLQKDGFKPLKLVDILVNFVISPALLIYTVILYIYFIKIVLMWSLPQGGIALMVFGFALLAVAAKAYQPMIGSRRLYDWFYDRFHWISLPALAMFWVGVCHRIGEYGLTEERVYLIVCGFIMTVVTLMFFSARWGRYLYATAAAIVLLAAFTYVPGMAAKELGIKSQRARMEKAITSLELMDENGKLKHEKRQDADSLQKAQYLSMLEAFDYLQSERDTAYLNDVCGMKERYRLVDEIVPDNVEYERDRYSSSGGQIKSFRIEAGNATVNVEGFRYLHHAVYGKGGGEFRYSCGSGKLQVYDAAGNSILDEGLDELLAGQLDRMGLTVGPGLRHEIEERGNEFFVLDRGGYRIVARSAIFQKDDSGLKLTSMDIEYVLSN